MATAERLRSGESTTEPATTTMRTPHPRANPGGFLPPAASPSSLLRPVPPAPARGGHAHPQTPFVRPALQPSAPRRRQGRRTRRSPWREPMTAAVLVGTLLVSLLCVYVYAYARVTAAGFEASRLRGALITARQEEQNLCAQISGLSLPGTVANRAKKLGMEMAASTATQMLPATEASIASLRGGPDATAETRQQQRQP